MRLPSMGLTFMIFIHEAMICQSIAKLRHLLKISLKRQSFLVWKSMHFILNIIANSWWLIFWNRKVGALQNIEGKSSGSTFLDFHPKAQFKELIQFCYEIVFFMHRTCFLWTNRVRVTNFLNLHTTSQLTSFQIDSSIKLLSIVVRTHRII